MITIEKLKSLLISDRTIRRYEESKGITKETLCSLVELTRYCASGRNVQPLRYLLVTETADREKIFPLLAWAGYLKDWDGPEPGERPAAYMLQCLDTTYGSNCLCDDGLQLQTITLGATTLGIGCCIIKAFNAERVKALFDLPDNLVPRYVLALGYPAETVVTESTNGTPTADIKYYRTADGTHHVPKRPLSELIVNID